MADKKRTGHEKPEQAKSNYVKAEFAIGAAIVCFVLGFFAARVVGNPNPLNQTSNTPARSTTIPIQSVSRDDNWIADLEKQTEENPESAVAWARLGNAYYDTDQYRNGIDAYTKSLDLSSDDPNVITDMGVMYRRLGDYSEAIRQFDRAAKVDPTHELSVYNKGIVQLHDLRDTQAAIVTWESLAKRNPQFRSPTGQLVSDMVRALK